VPEPEPEHGAPVRTADTILGHAVEEGWIPEASAAGMLRGLRAKAAGEPEVAEAVTEKVAWLQVLAGQRAAKRPGPAATQADGTALLPRCSREQAAKEELMGAGVLFEDEDLLFVDKPAGVVVQPTRDETDLALVWGVARYLQRTGGDHSGGPFVLQRLDRGTTGVLLFSKTPAANRGLGVQFQQHTIKKTYVAAVEGRLVAAQMIDAAIGRIGPIKFGVSETAKDSKEAATAVAPIFYRPAAAEAAGCCVFEGEATMVEARPRSGRTHQIRVHLASIGFPLVNDWLYGNRPPEDRAAGRPMLHASKLELSHPITGQPLCVAAPLPVDFAALFSRHGTEGSTIARHMR
jgi:23S rRNA pseudouridine1911/1915/1917 synthase